MQSHYMKQLVFTFESLDNAASAYDKLKGRVAALKASVKGGEAADGAAVKEYHDRFIAVVGNDLNTSLGLTLLYDVLKADIDPATKCAIIADFDTVLSLDLLKDRGEDGGEDLSELEELLIKRAEAKRNRDWAAADAIRDRVKEAGYAILDTPEGAKLKKL